MKKLIPIILVVAVLAGGYFVYSRSKKSTGGNSPLKIVKPKKAFSGTMLEAFKLGVPLKCTNKVEGEEGQGTIEGFVQGKKYAGKIMMNGKKQNILLKDNCMWSWEEGKTQGIKTCFEPAKGDEGAWGDLEKGQLNDNVSCVPTTVKPGTFSPPANVKFLDMDKIGGNMTQEQMQQLQKMSEENNQ